jgi:hypothetical protein
MESGLEKAVSGTRAAVAITASAVTEKDSLALRRLAIQNT